MKTRNHLAAPETERARPQQAPRPSLQRARVGVLTLLVLFVAPCLRAAQSTPANLPFPLIERFEKFDKEDGLPAWKVHCVLPAGDGKVWAGTTQGLVAREGGRFRAFGAEDGLSHQVVLCLAEDASTGDLWIGTMRGLSRLSGGRFTSYTQTSSGLPNNVIYGLTVWKGAVWVATAAGLGRLDLKTGSWSLYDHTNAIFHEPWIYALAPSPERLYVGVWGGGIVEFDPAGERWKEWRDPDGEMELNLMPNAGPIHDVTSGCAWDSGILWQGTYFGLARFDGQRWKTFDATHTGLSSDFINFVVARGKIGWIATDHGLCVTDGETWATYRRHDKSKGLLEITSPGGARETRLMSTALPDDFVLGMALGRENDIWLATAHGLAHGFFEPTQISAAAAGANSETQGLR
ncbi:MAG: ligand-binding sensor domain-containing protein [Limisphaerales bacterium]